MSDNPYMKRQKHVDKQSKAYWRAPKQEKNVATRIKGRTISGSGSGNKKGDVFVKGIARIECKTTQNKSFSITKDMLEKISNAGIGNDELPVMVIEFLDSKGLPDDEVAVMPMWALELLINKAQDNGTT